MFPVQMDGRELLTDFQIDKFKYFFYHVLDLNSDHVISEEDFIKLNDRIRHYIDWSVNTIQFLALKEVHDIFKVGCAQFTFKITGPTYRPCANNENLRDTKMENFSAESHLYIRLQTSLSNILLLLQLGSKTIPRALF